MILSNLGMFWVSPTRVSAGERGIFELVMSLEGKSGEGGGGKFSASNQAPFYTSLVDLSALGIHVGPGFEINDSSNFQAERKAQILRLCTGIRPELG
jgi:hypothetical protein